MSVRGKGTVELKVLEEFEHEGEKYAPGELVELPPRPAVEKIENGVAREASWTDFEG